MHGLRRALGVTMFGVSILLAAVSCREPTQLVVRVTTDFDCALLTKNEVSIYTGAAIDVSRPVTSSSVACANRNVGSVVVTPSGAGKRVLIDVMAALSPASLDANGRCDEKVGGCIHARREITYLNHTSLTIPITLELACSGHPCDPDETCRAGSCVSNTLDPSTCDPSSCTLPTQPPIQNPLAAECGTGATQPGAPYPGTAGCMARTGTSTEKGPTQAPTRDDTIPLDGQPTNAVIDRDNVVYVATDQGSLYAIVLGAKPSIRWQVSWAKSPSNAAGSMLLAADERLYLSADTAVHGYALGDGLEARPPVDLGANVNSDLGIGGTLLTVTTAPGNLVSVNTTTFAPGPVTGGGNLQTAPTYFGGRVWLGNNGGELHAYDATTLAAVGGTIQATTDRLSGIAGGPDGKLRLLFDDGNSGFAVAAFDPATSKTTWTRPLGVHPAMRIAVTHDGATWHSDDVTLGRVDANGQPSGTSIATSTTYPGFDVDGNTYVIESPSSELASYGPDTALRWRAAATSRLLEIVVARNGILVGLGTDAKVHVYR